MLAACQISFDDGADEIGNGGLWGAAHAGFLGFSFCGRNARWILPENTDNKGLRIAERAIPAFLFFTQYPDATRRQKIWTGQILPRLNSILNPQSSILPLSDINCENARVI